MKHIFFIAIVCASCAINAHAAEPLKDAALDAITAGAESEPERVLKLDAQRQTASGRTVRVDGTLDVERAASSDSASLLLRDSAQSNLRSLVNINAVQSNVNVLLNLNIMIDSQVGELKQLNLRSN